MDGGIFYFCCKRIMQEFQLFHATNTRRIFLGKTKLYIPITLHIDLILWRRKTWNRGLNHGLIFSLFKFFWMKIHSKLNKFRTKTRLLYCFRSQVFTWNTIKVSGKSKTNLSIPEIFFIFRWLMRVCFTPIKYI